MHGRAAAIGRRGTELLGFLGFEDMILLRTGGLAASPPVRYTLETAEEYLARYGRATRMRWLWLES